MKAKLKSLGLGLSATTISALPSLLLGTSAACTGICGSCGGGCAGLIVGMGAAGLIFFNRWCNKKKVKFDVDVVTANQQRGDQ